MFISRTGLLAVLAVVLVAVASAQVSADVYWGNSSGTASYFTWSGGHNSDTNLFGDPTVVGGNTFRFTSSSFRADAQDGSTDAASDTAQWDVFAKPTYTFTEIRIIERGDWGITGSGSGNHAKVQGLVEASTYSDPFDYVQDPWIQDWITEGGGVWTHTFLLDVSALNQPATELHVYVENNLFAISSGTGNLAFIQKKLTGAIVDVEVIPEPATLALLAMGMLPLLRRRG